MTWTSNWLTLQKTCVKMKLGKSKLRINPCKVAVIVYDINGLFICEVVNNLKNIQKETEGKVEFQFFSSNEKQDTQNKILDKILQNENFKLLLVELVDLNASQEVINKVKQHNIPIVLFSREPPNKNPIKSYYKAIFVGTVLEQAGILEGEILIDEWNKKKSIIDKNKDNIMQYIMFKGQKDNLEAIARAKYSVLTIKNSGINIMELDLAYSDWNNKEEAKKLMELLFLRFGNKIEAIISTNDTMAIGAIEILQRLGYNNGNKERTIPIVGVDAVPEARELVKKGFMTGTIIQDAHAMAEAIYITGMNLALNKNPLDGTTYKFDDSGVTIRIPYSNYVPS
ncbi:galactose ABC transporter substrate-binding protein [Clostridium cibarium]|uniref:D-galactose/methyl-galactoside binding periplasmic protein MglB n=1 Tax=Clostridium cibarium TaxID=2762247 RepID=A0ABR8PUM5_9CLOT|nr:galactose ABC transporter substrate-binding protein [Clostridium cibarium]MBD7911867.1 galactose ABC transporter substrate-binding protein [Clostridium cibarium]